MKNACPIPRAVELRLMKVAKSLKSRGFIMLSFTKDEKACWAFGETKEECEKMGELVDQIRGKIDSGLFSVWD